jgi:hypothetical protein
VSAKSSLRKVSVGHANGWRRGAISRTTSNRKGQQTPQQRVVSTGIKLRMGSETSPRCRSTGSTRSGISESMIRRAAAFPPATGKKIPRHTYTSLGRYAGQPGLQLGGHHKNMMDRAQVWSGTGPVLTRVRYCGDIYVSQSFAGDCLCRNVTQLGDHGTTLLSDPQNAWPFCGICAMVEENVGHEAASAL